MPRTRPELGQLVQRVGRQSAKPPGALIPIERDESMRQLAPCPSSPNCVSTQAVDAQHAIAPMRFQKRVAEAKALVVATVLSLPRTRLVEEDTTYLHFEFTSRLLRFVDDVEFLFDGQTHVLHFRSASRIGYGDLGVNRRRMEELRRLLEPKL